MKKSQNRWWKSRKPASCSLTFRPALETLEQRVVFAVDSYLVPTAPSVDISPILTVGDAVPESDAATDLFDDVATPQDGLYRMVGIPDGLGAFDNGNGTFTVLMNHEVGSTQGIARDHGSKGSFVSKWVIDKTTLQVLEGDDLIKTLYLWDSVTNSFVVGSGALNALNRLCSADLPETTAFFNPATGLGSTARIFMNGEESSNGRAFAHVVTGSEAGTSWELPWTGKYAWENHVTSPFPQDKTVVIGLDDSRREFSSEGATEPSEVYVWVGNKKNSGLEINKAGLVDGVLHGLRVGTPGSYDANENTVSSGERFELVALSDQTNNPTFTALQTESISKSITQFRRVEDGHFDTTNPNVFYFVTTDQFAGATRLWKLTFDDITNPAAGGKIEIAFDSPAGVPGEMFDNMTVNYAGDVLLQEDPGNQSYLARIWQHDSETGDLIEVAQHNPALFGAAGIDILPGIPGVQSTQDEESSGIIDLSHILGEGYYLTDVQAHYSFTATTDPTGELVQAGQLLVMNTNAASAELAAGVLTVQGTINDDNLQISRHGKDLTVYFHGESLGTFKTKDVHSIRMEGSFASDVLSIAQNVNIPAILRGGNGNDLLVGSGDPSILIGDAGSDVLVGRSDSDLLIGGTVTLDDATLASILFAWSSNRSYNQRVSSLRSSFNAPTVIDDAAVDYLFGAGSRDWFFASLGDQLIGRKPNEFVN